MKSLHTKHIVILSACTVVLGIFLGCPFLSQAASHNITVKNGDQLNIPLYTGDNGTITTDRTTITIPESVITPDPSTETTKPDDAASLPSQPDSSNKDPENSAPDKGNASDTSGNPPAVPDTSETIPDNPVIVDPKKKEEAIQAYLDSLHFIYNASSDSSVLSFDTQTHQFQALKPGTASITIQAFEPEDLWNQYPVFTATITFSISVDMTNVTLTQNALTAYLSPMYTYGKKKPYYSSSTAEFQIGINSSYVFNPDTDYSFDYSDYYDPYYDDYYPSTPNTSDLLSYSYTESDKVQINITLAKNVLYIRANLTGTNARPTTSIITLTLSGKTFTIPLTLSPLTISNQSLLLVKGKKKALKVTGTTEAIQWTSTNSKIATVNSKGVIKGKKIGNCVIIGKIGNSYVGCAVSVTTAQLKKVATYANYMGTHWTYSQAKRTQTGYYDCSALVWKAYKKYSRVNFGSAGYPGVALSEAKWCNAHHKMLKGGYRYRKIYKMQYNPGDLVFKSTNMKKKYADIYHVEMITGYYCYGVSSTGSPYIDLTWGARGTGYGAEEGSLLGRPMK